MKKARSTGGNAERAVAMQGVDLFIYGVRH
jgi:hypothetical protein